MTQWRALKLGGVATTLLLAVMAVGDERRSAAAPMDAEFRFVRLQYSEHPGARGWRRWLVDYPEAEHFFTQGVGRLTRVDIGRPEIVSLTDDSLFVHPWLYAVEVGYWYLSDAEAERLREYLLRGGFLMVDDFHGTQEWAQFLQSMTRVFPDRPIVDIPDGDPVLHVLYDLDERIQIPGIGAWMRGRTYERDGYEPHWRGIYDDHDRLMVAINFNMDLGDAWEHADDPRYPEPMTRLAYQYAVNYVIYAMSH